MRFLCITQYHGSGITALSKPGLQRRGKAPGASVFFDHPEVHFFAFHSGQAIFFVFPS
jgi:hypothetical protein